jgi:TRAP-type mannitol/chloroaromatic compound transport system permease small subunit
MTQDITTHPDAARWMPMAVRISKALSRFVDVVGRWGSWLILPVVLITVYDAFVRKFFSKAQVWAVENVSSYFGSTILQELEWHFHTGLFALVLGYGIIYNTHVRVDLVRENLSFRNKARLEFWGLTVFMIPFCSIIIWFAVDWIHSSYAMGEISASQVGLTHRWMIKSVLLSGLCVALVGGFAVWLQVLLVLWAPEDARFELSTLDWPEEDTSIEGVERLKIDYGLSDEAVSMDSDDGPAPRTGTSTD